MSNILDGIRRTGGTQQPTSGSNYTLPTPQPEAYPDPADWDYKTATVNMDGEALPPGAIGWRPDGTPDFGAGFMGWAKSAYNNIQKSWFEGWEEGERIAEDNGYQSDLMPRWSSSLEAGKAIGSELLFGGLNAIGQLAIWTKQAGAAVGFGLRDYYLYGKSADQINWKENWEVGRLAYNAVFQGFTEKGDTLRQEFLDRMQNGERPDLIAEDMQIRGDANPWVELVGELVFDPLNADLAMNWFSKGRKTAATMKAARAAFLTPEVAEVKKLKEVLDAVAKTGDELSAAKGFDAAFQAQRAALSGADEMVQVLQKPGQLKKVVAPISQLPKRIKQYAGLISDSRHAALINRSGFVIENIVKSVKDPDDIITVIEKMVVMQGEDVRAAEDAFRYLTKQKAMGAIFSEAGNEFAAIAKRMVTKYSNDWFNAIEIAAKSGGTEAVAEVLMKRLSGTMEEMFPKAEEMAKAYDAMKAGKELTEAERKLADLGGRMSKVERSVARMHAAAQAGPIGMINKAFITLYMDWSPAYAFRNGTQNSIQIFLDYGPAMFFDSADNVLAKAEKMNGGALHSAVGLEIGKAASGGAAAKAKSVKAATTWEAIKTMFSERSVRAASEVFETGAARRIVGHSYTKTFKQALDPMIKSLRKEKAFAAIPENVWNVLKNEIINNYGDVKSAMEVVKTANRTGVIDIFKDMSKVPGGLRKYLEGAMKADDFIETVLKAKSKEEAVTGLNKIFDDLKAASSAAYLDSRYATTELDNLMMLAQKEGVSTSLKGKLLNVQQQINNATIGAVENAISKLDSFLDQQGLRIDKAAIKRSLGMNFADWGTRTSQELTLKRNRWWNVYEDLKGTRDPQKQLEIIQKSWDEIARYLDGRVEMPKTREEFGKTWPVFEKLQNETWLSVRGETLDVAPQYLDEIEKALGQPLPPEYRTAIDEAIAESQKWANVSIGEYGVLVDDGVQLTGSRKEMILQLAKQYGISSATEAGIPLDKKIVRIINKYGTGMSSLDDPVSIELVERAFAKHSGQAGKGISNITPLLPPYQSGTVPSFARGLMEGNMEEVQKLLTGYVEKNFGRVESIVAGDYKLDDLVPLLEQRVNDIRTISAKVAEENRNFTLLNYGQRTYLDVASAYLFPYGFWYKGTYNNWIQRIVQNPAVIAGYGKYKRAMLTAHAGLPDWWKQNVQIDSFMGIDLENPLYFNLEATLWPLNGITGEDFNDPKKRVDWWSYSLDQVGKFGPSTWTPLNIITGLMLRNQGETEASDRWLGRLIPQTALVKTWTNMELDPLVGMMQGGLDPYERRRVGRALSDMVASGAISKEQAIDAARAQSGEDWDNAVKNSNASRKMAQTMSTLFGVGFKPRTQSDMAIDKFDNDYRRLMTMNRSGYIDADTFREQMALLAERYPFMDTVLISRRGGSDRDTALGYNVLSRIPPGEASGLLELLGVSSDMVDRFYSDRGDMTTWTEGDRLRMTSAFIDLAATFKMPDLPTKQEWNSARSMYGTMRTAIASELGEDIWEKVDMYYDSDPDTRTALMEMFPEIQDAFDMKNAYVVNNEILNKYYGGADTINMYYSSQARQILAQEFGENITDISRQYMEILDAKEKKAFKKAHPELNDYYKRKNELDAWVIRQSAETAAKMPTRGEAPLRDPKSETQKMLGQALNPQPVDWQAELGPEMMGFITEYANGESIPYTVQQRLDFLSSRYGYYSGDEMLSAILQSLYSQ